MNNVLPKVVLRPITKEIPYKILFVCLGNICRSPTAEGIMQHLVRNEGFDAYFEIDSAGTSAYHTGELPDSRSRDTALRHGIELLSRSRKFESFDLDYFDLILPMDSGNSEDILAFNPKRNEHIILLRQFDGLAYGSLNVPDPYYGGKKGFEEVFMMIERSCKNLLDELTPFIQ